VVCVLEREAELDLLCDMVEQAAGGHGCVALVGGEAGIGKTSLVEAVRERSGAAATFISGACEPLSVPLPLGPWRELVEAADGGDLLDVGSDDRLVLARRVATALEDRAPVVAVVEDVHWADPLTLDLVRLLTRRVERMRAVIIVTYRADEVAGNPALGMMLGDLAGSTTVRRITLRPLSPVAVAELVGTSGLDPLDLARVTGGNPFLVVEAVAAGDRLPASVRDAALARAGRLGAAARQVVAAAAVIGQRFDHALLDAVVPGGAEAVEEALARGVLVADGGRLGFRHELIREAIEASVSPPRLAGLHARVFEALTAQAGTTDSARLAHHAELAGLRGEACRYAGRASLEAERVGALRETRLQAERAIRLGDELAESERFELLLRYSRASNFSSTRYEDAIDSARQALMIAERIGDPLLQARALGALSWALWSFDCMLEARNSAQRAIELLETTSDVAALARAESARIRIEATAFDPQAALVAGTRALELAGAARLDDVRLDITISVALALGHRGEHEALTELADAVAIAQEAHLPIQAVRAYVNLLFTAATLRAHGLLDAVVEQALRFCEEQDAQIPYQVIEGSLARSLMDRGRWTEAARAAARSRRSWHSEVPMVRALEGLMAARRGEPGASSTLDEAWAEIPKSVEDARHDRIRCALVEAAWLVGDHAAARDQVAAAASSATLGRYARSGGELALWARRYAIPFTTPARVPRPIELELEGDWRRAIRAWRELEAPYEAALAALPGDDRAASDALSALNKLGAAAAADAFNRTRAQRGARPVRGARRSTLDHPAGLTLREQEVLELLATGATNPAIAAHLQLSARTVAHHVSAILVKLEAANRLAAVEQARGRGLLSQDGQVAEPR